MVLVSNFCYKPQGDYERKNLCLFLFVVFRSRPLSEKKFSASTKGMLLDVTKYRISESLAPPLTVEGDVMTVSKKRMV